MIQVKENLFNGEEKVSVIAPRTYVALKIPELEIGETYTISFNLSQNEYGSGKSTVTIFDKTITKRTYRGLADIGYNEISFVYGEDTNRLLLYVDDFDAEKDDRRLSIYRNIMINRGGSGLYIPHKSKVKAENQAIFPIGGGIMKSSPYIEVLSNLPLGRRLLYED